MLIGVDSKTSRKFAFVSDTKRANNQDIVEQVLQFLRQLGHYGDLEIHTDGESSFVELA